MTEATPSHERQQAWRAIGLFLLILVVLSAIINVVMVQRGGATLLIITALMWVPGIAALLSCRILKRPVASMPWGFGEWRWNVLAWALPIMFGLAMYLPVWLFGLGGSAFGNPDTIAAWTKEMTGGESNAAGAIAYVLLLGTIGIVVSASRALGEEIGWRGFLIWEMRKVMPFWAVGVVSGLIWCVWHWPAIILLDYNSGAGNPTLSLLLFTIGIVPHSIVYAYLTFRSKSLWPAVILHASHNLFIQQVFSPITVQGESTNVYIGEFGVMLPIVGWILAAYFLWRARREGIA